MKIPFCTQPGSHIDVIVENNFTFYKPCNVYQHSFDKIDFVDVKHKINNNEFADGCNYCYEQEKNGTVSRRQAINLLYEDHNLNKYDKIQSIGLRYGTLCNSTCLICDHTRSSSWATKDIKNGLQVDTRYIYDKKLMPTLDTIFKDIDLSYVRYVEFHGGEPLINSYPIDMLDMLNKDNLYVKINTNGSVFPEKIIKELNKCKNVEMLFSIDDIHERLEYLRPPIKFDTLTNNIELSKKNNYKTGCMYTISDLNVYYLPEFITWAKDIFNLNLYGQFTYGPIHNIRNLKKQVKEKVINKFEKFSNIQNHLQPVVDYMKMEPFGNKKGNLNTIKNTKEFKKTFKEWAIILND